MIYVVLLSILALIGFFLFNTLKQTNLCYDNGIKLANRYYEEFARDKSETASFRPDISFLYILSYSRANNFATVKYAALFLGYIIVVVGCLFVLYGAQAYYKLKMESKEIKSALETTSPGLVLITLGIILVGVTLLIRSETPVDTKWIYQRKDLGSQKTKMQDEVTKQQGKQKEETPNESPSKNTDPFP